MLGVTVSAGLGVRARLFRAGHPAADGRERRQIVELGSDFARIMLGGNVTVFMIFLINAIFRGAGDAVLAMRTLWLANAFNIVLGPCFIFGWGPFPEMGVTGAAVATNIGRGIGVLYQLWHLAGHNSRVRVRLHHFRPAFDVMQGDRHDFGQRHPAAADQHHQLGRPVQDPVDVRQRRAGRLHDRDPHRGVRADAGLGTGERRRDAGRTEPRRAQPDRAEAAVRIATRFNVIFLGIVGAVFVIFAYPLVSLFTERSRRRSPTARARCGS